MKAWRETSWGLERVENVQPGNVPAEKFIDVKHDYEKAGQWKAKCAEVNGIYYISESRIDK